MLSAASKTVSYPTSLDQEIHAAAAAALEAESRIDATDDPATEESNMATWRAAMELAASTPAMGLAGLAAKAAAMRATFQGNSFESRLVTSLLDDAERIAGVRAAGA